MAGRPAIRRASHKRNGGRHCCQPPLRRAKDLPVFVTWSTSTFRPSLTRSRSWLTSSGVASTEPLPLSRSPTDLLDCAARRFAGLSTFPARRLGPKSLEAKTVQCSAALLGSAPPASRFAHRRSEDLQEPRRAREDRLFRRLFPAGPVRTRRLLPILPAEIGPLVTCRAIRPFPAFCRGRDRRPDHPCTMHPCPESGKRKMRG
jgi:hypothetical protein